MSQLPLTELPELFSAAWAEAICQGLADNSAFRHAARRWEGGVAFALSGQAEPRAVSLDLRLGECRGAGLASAEDLSRLKYVMVGTAETWRDVLLGSADPLATLLAGKLRLARGSLTSLIPHARAAQELIAAVRQIPARVPAAWEGA